MHLKNFSLIEEKAASRRFGLSAAYDLLPVNIIMPADHEQTALTLNGKKSNIRKKDFLSLAENLNIGEKTASGLLRQLLKHREKFINIVNDSYVSEEMKDSLKQLIDQRANVLM
jgi:serine/threonine-protein kinase HipA